jgi:hypothetical protein
MVTINQLPGIGQVAAVPSGWQRIYEHTPTTTGSDPSPYQGWFALSNCPSGTQNVSFSVVSLGTSTTASLVVNEFSGLPDPVAEDFAVNSGSPSSVTSASQSGQTPASSGELTLTALSFYGSSPSSTTPSGWNAGGSSTSTLPAYTYWQVGSSSAPSASYSWSPSSSYEITMLALKAGPTSPAAPNVVQQNQVAFTGQTSVSATLPAGVTAGDAVVVMLSTDGGGGEFQVSVLSGGGVTWESVTGIASSGNSAEVWAGYGSSGTSGATTITATLTEPDDGTLVVAEVAGINGVDMQSTNSNNNANPTGGSFTPHSGDLLVGLMTANFSTLELHPTPNWSTFSTTSGNVAAEWWSDVPNSSSSPQWLISPSGRWATVQVAFNEGPTVTSVSPGSGQPTGGTAVTVTGTNFTGATAVNFGGSSASFSVNSATSITATSPSHSLGTVDVTVTTPQGTSDTSAADQFTYAQLPTVTGVSPSTGSAGGGTTVTVSGANLTGATAVSFGSARATGVTVNGGGTSLTAVSPAGSGTVNVTVTTPSGTSATSSADLFSYQGYWEVAKDGGIFAFGAPFNGSAGGLHLSAPIVGMAYDAANGGYWLVGSDGGIFAYGGAPFYGSMGGTKLNAPIVGMAANAQGTGYWLVASDGGIFAFGTSSFHGFHGSMGGTKLNKPVVGMAVTPDGGGYWEVASDGGIFAFGDAPYHGSMGGSHINAPVVGMAAQDAGGYWLVGSDGGLYAFGDALFKGSMGGSHLNAPVVGMAYDSLNGGYWLVASDGGLFAFGGAPFLGSTGGTRLNQPVVGMAFQ